ncbi:MAG: four helix bundle protein [Nitrospirota bacterium]
MSYAVDVVKISTLLRKTATGREIAGQLLRSGTSSGANYEEARGAQSRADFLHKLQIVLKELRESLFWLRLIDKAQIIKEQGVASAIDETRQLGNIIAKSVVTAKKQK